MNYTEENNYPKAFVATGVILAVIMALCYFIVFTNPPRPEDGTGGILVNYGTTDEGKGSDYMSTEQPSIAEKANNTKPDKVTPAPPTEQKTQVESSNKNVVTQNTEDAPEVTANTKKPSPTVATPAKPVAKHTIAPNTLYTGPHNNGTGSGDGTTNTPGNQGKPTGSTLTNNYNGTGSGNGGSLNLPNWRFANPPDVKNERRVPGTVVIDFTIDQNGNVLEAHSNRQKTRAELNLVQNCIDAIKASKFTSSGPTSGNQQGEMSFIFKVD